jgi:hypothetical protein
MLPQPYRLNSPQKLNSYLFHVRPKAYLQNIFIVLPSFQIKPFALI